MTGRQDNVIRGAGVIDWELLNADPPVSPKPRTFCEVCGDELPGNYHPAVLLITHYKWSHASNDRKVAA